MNNIPEGIKAFKTADTFVKDGIRKFSDYNGNGYNNFVRDYYPLNPVHTIEVNRVEWSVGDKAHNGMGDLIISRFEYSDNRWVAFHDGELWSSVSTLFRPPSPKQETGGEEDVTFDGTEEDKQFYVDEANANHKIVLKMIEEQGAYERSIKRAYAEIDRQHDEIRALKAKISEMYSGEDMIGFADWVLKDDGSWFRVEQSDGSFLWFPDTHAPHLATTDKQMILNYKQSKQSKP